MSRLCERPGCSESASVAYGMRPEDLVFWLDALRDDATMSGVLCRRHADSMIVPRNWTLDDLRDPDLHLFRPPPVAETTTRRNRRNAPRDATGEQLRLGVLADDAPDDAESAPTVTATPAADAPSAAPMSDEVADESTTSSPWMPDFDAGDDLDGLLSARSPLLARAFRGDDRRR